MDLKYICWVCAVTFLALGNGAPDISSSIAAIRAGNFEMALGALLGEQLLHPGLHIGPAEPCI